MFDPCLIHVWFPADPDGVHAWRLSTCACHYGWSNAPLSVRVSLCPHLFDVLAVSKANRHPAVTPVLCWYQVYLQKRYVEMSGMRLTFPYFIGPATWVWHHAVAERAAAWQESDPNTSAALVEGFKEYLAVFVTLYPCPYCRCTAI